MHKLQLYKIYYSSWDVCYFQYAYDIDWNKYEQDAISVMLNNACSPYHMKKLVKNIRPHYSGSQPYTKSVKL